MNRMQPLALHPVLNRPTTEPERGQLGMRHGSVLPVSKLREEGVRRSRTQHCWS